ncbi:MULTISPECIES: acetylglutamate kinase [Thalassospira]|jgi:acetylglutamate kinase|uniref:Acetylglutamate kinase n=3 Tax=Thalassospira TaxID=168934 RepID=A0A853KVJ2_9PROT|nr:MULTISPECIES: acetylglutamate kinase [Thalassospira]OAZ13538.1 acetylglutamate kinase [Thalassospira profundimaris]AXO15976.1 acetylglutamate kinase [Thalassospira indica]EKF06986.1 acetylglutamate kinase [Thalassospira profundimaris WP0211]MBO6580380.1 acetylglutamate kinase [Thalassospira sp.]MBO6818260.1 acetylglutamate kinase [Thalassospira sp.]|tara:strand:- start:661 stop:1590 length:930 start_codon:yes stop_codon:yes gene_type:complete
MNDQTRSEEDQSEASAYRMLARAQVLSEALPFMRRFNGQKIVVKYGGHAMGDPELARLFAQDMVLLKQVGMNPIVVHGGGPQIGQMLKQLNIQSEFVDGLRVTDQQTIDVVEMVLAGKINKEIVSNINAAGGVGVGLCGKDANLITARKLTRTKRDPESNIEKVLDLGFVGEPVKVDPHVLDCFIDTDIIPVISPIGVGEDGQTYNINADTAAGAIAKAVGASRLYMLTDVKGILDQNKNLVRDADTAHINAMIADGTIQGGMIPKTETCMDAVENGVEAAVIVDGRAPHAVLLELFTERGAGTMIRGN